MLSSSVTVGNSVHSRVRRHWTLVSPATLLLLLLLQLLLLLLACMLSGRCLTECTEVPTVTLLLNC
jgi:hypothetical protein